MQAIEQAFKHTFKQTSAGNGNKMRSGLLFLWVIPSATSKS
jgi:hypothetical protein